MPAFRYKDVGWLDIAVDDAFTVSGIQRIGNLNGQPQLDIGFDRFSCDAMLKGHAFKKLHDEEGTTILLADVIDGADIGVIERGGGAGFAAKAFEYLLVPGQVFGEKLERNKAAQARVLRPVNHAHSTTAKLLHNAVVRESRVNHCRAAWIQMVDHGK